MNRPDRVKVGPINFSINSFDPEEEDFDFGRVDWLIQAILIREGLFRDSEVETVLHEIMHCIFDQSGIDISNKKEERFIRALSPAIISLLRGNPKLVEYLCQDLK